MDGTVTEYLGIGIEEIKTYKGKLGYQLTQEGIIKKILSTTGMIDCNEKAIATPVENPLVNNPYGEPTRHQTKWLYVSIIGIMTYFAFNSWPEI